MQLSYPPQSQAGPAAFNTVQYEGYGPGCTAVLIECSAPERADFAAQLRRAFTEHGGFLGARGSVSYLFARTGVLIYAPSSHLTPPVLDESGAVQPSLAELALAAGAEDVLVGSGGIEILTDPEDFQGIRAALFAAGFVALSATITQRPATTVALNAADAENLRTFVAGLDTLDDVHNVYTNAQFPPA